MYESVKNSCKILYKRYLELKELINKNRIGSEDCIKKEDNSDARSDDNKPTITENKKELNNINGRSAIKAQIENISNENSCRIMEERNRILSQEYKILSEKIEERKNQLLVSESNWSEFLSNISPKYTELSNALKNMNIERDELEIDIKELKSRKEELTVCIENQKKELLKRENEQIKLSNDLIKVKSEYSEITSNYKIKGKKHHYLQKII